ncbi:MAG: response regulator transcription factor [Synechococcaceae cyanobacterium SM2_3_60]|nr:response regulator transcription factor [Synechococcaceae cyanobacterium SM2_3_60]
MSASIIVVEDDPRLAQFLVTELGLEGYAVHHANNGLDGLSLVRDIQPDLVILDWLLPGLSGLDICLRLRATGITIPILMLTAKDEVPERVAGLNAGADDYITKPFSIEELLARVKAHLRRLQSGLPDRYTFGDLSLTLTSREVYRQQHPIQLTAKEFDLLAYLMQHPRQVLTREQMLEAVWGYDFMGESNIIEVYIRALRIKLENGGLARLIHTVRSIGYVLREPN